MPYLNLDLDYFEHRKTKRLVGRLGKGADVLPLKLWVYTGKHHAEDGRLSGYSEQEIASIVGWWRDPSEFAQAMLDVGFMGRDDQGYFIHEWLAHEGHLNAFKARAKKGAAARWSKLVASSSDALSIAPSEAKPDDKQCAIRTSRTNSPLSPPRGAREKSWGRRGKRKDVDAEVAAVTGVPE